MRAARALALAACAAVAAAVRRETGRAGIVSFSVVLAISRPPPPLPFPSRQQRAATCDDACQRHVKLVEGAILAFTLLVALGSGVAFMRGIDVPTRFLGGGGGGGGGDGGS